MSKEVAGGRHAIVHVAAGATTSLTESTREELKALICSRRGKSTERHAHGQREAFSTWC